MKVAVTGAGGFLGKALVVRLANTGHQPLAIVKSRDDADSFSHQGYACLCHDLSHEQDCLDAFSGCDALVHCAAMTRSFGRWDEFRKSNIDLTESVMSAALKAQIPRIIHISTTAVYGNERNHYGTDEEADFGQRVVDPYTRSKIAADQIVLSLIKNKSLPAVILRFGNFWGPGDQIVLPFIVSGLRQKRLMIEGGGDNLLSLTFVDNAVHGIILALEHGDSPGKIYNITDCAKVTSRKFIDDIIAILGIKYRLRNISYPILYSLSYLLEQFYMATKRDPNPPLTRFVARVLKYNAMFDISRAINELGFRPVVSYKQALTISTPYVRSLYYGNK
jgi:nucleoside-diphosphate-sugar epimerase